MAWEIISTALFFVIAMLALLLGMKNHGWFAGGIPQDTEWEFSPLNAHQVSIFFTTYVVFQVWNIINCRSLSAYESGLKGVFTNPAFIAIMLLILLGQMLIIQVGGSVFKVQPLGLSDWFFILLGTSVVLIKAEISRFFQRIRTKQTTA